jgi:ribosome-binding factor A
MKSLRASKHTLWARSSNEPQRVSHFLHEELARLLQSTVRDPRVQQINLTGVEVSRDLSHAKVFFTLMNDVSAAERAEVSAVSRKYPVFCDPNLAKVSAHAHGARMSFRFDESVGRGRDMETLLRKCAADEQLH